MPGKYRAQPVVIDGLRFASKAEARRYGELRLLEKAGEIADLRCQPAFKVEIAGQHYCTYTADFAYREVKRLDEWGKVLAATTIEEVKSVITRKDPAYRLRRKAAELFHGISVKEVVL